MEGKKIIINSILKNPSHSGDLFFQFMYILILHNNSTYAKKIFILQE